MTKLSHVLFWQVALFDKYCLVSKEVDIDFDSKLNFNLNEALIWPKSC